MESAGAFVADRIRRWTPRRALLATLAAISIGFISMDFILRIFNHPGAALLPLGVILVQYFGRVKLPLHIPGGLLAIALGTLLAWLPVEGIGFMEWQSGETVAMEFKFALPMLTDALFSARIWDYASIIVPMGLFSIIGSLQNIESAAAGGDEFDTRSSLLTNGIGTVVASLLGSCFPTTIYIGHPGWKAIGARQGYSALNGIVIFLLSVFGIMGLVVKVIPIEAGAAIVFWIAIVITAQAFQVNSKKHAPAIVLGLIPGIVAWGLLLVQATLAATGTSSLHNLGLDAFATTALAPVAGLIALERGFLFTCMIWSAAAVHIIDRKFLAAAVWIGIAAVLSWFGFIHSYELTPQGIAYHYGFNVNRGVSVGYLLFALYLVFVHLLRNARGK
jgi:AGZA family xanthine/uracil permease-like MFS transporter